MSEIGTHISKAKRDTSIKALKINSGDNRERQLLHDGTLASLLERIAQLEAKVEPTSRSKPTSSPPDTPSDPDKHLFSMYIDMDKNQSGSYDKKDGQRPTYGYKCKVPSPPYILTTYWNHEGEGIGRTREKTMLEIRSKSLIELMRNAMEKMIEHDHASVWKKHPVTIPSTQTILGHCFDDLRAVAKEKRTEKDSDPEERTGLEALSQLLEDLQYIEPENVCARDFVNNEQATSYERLWSLFPPGSEVIGWPFQDSPQIFIVHRLDARKDLTMITCWAYDWDGTTLVRCYYKFVISEFQGSRSVTDLPCYPLSFHKDSTGLRKQLIERGKKFRQYCSVPQPTPLYRSNNFFTTPERTREDHLDRVWMLMNGTGGPLVEYKSSQDYEYDIIIDAALCKRYATYSYPKLGDMRTVSVKVCECALCDMDGLRKPFEESFRPNGTETSADEQLYSLLPPRVHGYLLGWKEWGQVLVDGIRIWQDREPSAAWKELAISQKDKHNIKSIVSAYFQSEAQGGQMGAKIKDPIPGKGKGVVILLHGIPGVGKTMTAETLATSMGRRLLRIDASDFEHNNARQVSDVFKRYFHMASSWGALLLLDEGDVFLQSRVRVELTQNALVSVLLRELEYFQGVLIMTTNRIVSVDYAVQSRIHYAVRFQQLREDEIERIWGSFRRQLTDENCASSERTAIDRWFGFSKGHLTDSKFTGRDIRNVFMCAQLLGYPKVTCENLIKAVESTTSFRRNLEKDHQKSVNQNTVVED